MLKQLKQELDIIKFKVKFIGEIIEDTLKSKNTRKTNGSIIEELSKLLW